MVNYKNFYKKSKKYRRRNNYPDPRIKKTILFVILFAGVVVIFGMIYAIFFNHENVIKTKISALATDYYENYFYKKLTSSKKFTKIQDLDTAMEKYHTGGLTPVTLDNLLLYDNQKHEKERAYLTKYCDEDRTIVKFYMDPPYERTSYHYDITYSCNF